MWYEGFCTRQNFHFIDYFAMMEGETCPHHPEGKKKKPNKQTGNDLYKWIMSSRLLDDYGNVT